MADKFLPITGVKNRPHRSNKILYYNYVCHKQKADKLKKKKEREKVGNNKD